MFSKGKLCFVVLNVVSILAVDPPVICRERSNNLRQDGGLCFEIPPWEHQPVELEKHLSRLRSLWGNNTDVRRHMLTSKKVQVNSEVSRYMDTVLAPFLDTYHRNIQNSYQQMTGKIMRRIKEEISAAVIKKQTIYTELTSLADNLKVPAMCDEERREARTIANQHVARKYSCTEAARESIDKMGRYAEEMVLITRNHMQATLDDATKELGDVKKTDTTTCLTDLSRAAVSLGYELDLSLTNARRHNEHSCEKLTACSTRVKHQTDELVTGLKEKLYQCVYA